MPKTWILPCVLPTARAYFPSDITIRALKHVYHTALGTDSWGITLNTLAQPRDLGGGGGYSLPTPKIWLHAQFGLPFHKMLQAPAVFSDELIRSFRRWCAAYGVCPNAWALPYLRMGPVPYKTFGFMQFCFKSFSISSAHGCSVIVARNLCTHTPAVHFIHHVCTCAQK